MTEDMSTNPEPAVVSDGASEKRSGLRTCLLVGVGCLAVIAIVICLATAFFLPRVRSVVQDIGSEIGIETLQDLEDLSVPTDLLDDLVMPTEAPDLCVEALCLAYPPGLNIAATVISQPEELEPDVWAVPAHNEIRFTTYPLQDRFHEPQMSIFDVERFRQVNPNAGPIIDELSALIVARPPAPESIPLIPIFNAGQMVLTQVAYLDFEGGSGVRFVTQYGQALWPINNHDLFYAFIGLSDDGRTLISSIMPITNAGLPDDPETVAGDDYDAFAEGYQAYIETTQAMLDAAGPGTFSPDLGELDALMLSIELFGAQ
jgi:hypothetical protein